MWLSPFFRLGNTSRSAAGQKFTFTCLRADTCFRLLRKWCSVKVVNAAEPSRTVCFKVDSWTATQANTVRDVFILDNYPLNASFVFFCSTSRKWPHDKGWSLPLCSLQRLFIHIFICGAFSPHVSGAPLQYKGKPPPHPPDSYWVGGITPPTHYLNLPCKGGSLSWGQRCWLVGFCRSSKCCRDGPAWTKQKPS